jgi:hypothetical protein
MRTIPRRSDAKIGKYSLCKMAKTVLSLSRLKVIEMVSLTWRRKTSSASDLASLHFRNLDPEPRSNNAPTRVRGKDVRGLDGLEFEIRGIVRNSEIRQWSLGNK